MNENIEREIEKKPKTKLFFKKFAIIFFTLLLLICILFFGATTVISYGPSVAAKNLFVTSVMETSAAKFLARMYFEEEEIQAILDSNSIVELDEITDTSLITIPDDIDNSDGEGLIIEEIDGSTYSGKMFIVKDPSRVFVGTSTDNFSPSIRGLRVDEIIDRYDAIAGTNAGMFEDVGGVGDGSMPLGIVISNGKHMFGGLNYTYDIIGFDEDDKLVLGKMTAQEALDRNIRDAVSFGPNLIVNGEVLEVKGMGSGLNPRTAIGQTADGTVLLLTIDGRQSSSLGASMSDLIEIMLDYGAINAANLDGGSSTVMYYEGELINVCASLYGSRDLPTAIVIANEDDNDSDVE